MRPNARTIQSVLKLFIVAIENANVIGHATLTLAVRSAVSIQRSLTIPLHSNPFGIEIS